MMLGLSLPAFTQLHVLISLVGIAAGAIFFVALAARKWLGAINGVFLIFTILTSVTGFLFPILAVTPAFIFGCISLFVLAIALYALAVKKRAGRWHTIYIVTALFAQYLNMVVLIIQSFLKIPALNRLAPLGNEPPLLGCQAVLLVAVLFVGWKAVRRPSA